MRLNNRLSVVLLLVMKSSQLAADQRAAPTANVNGRLFIDSATISQNNIQKPLQDGIELRALRLGLGGELTPQCRYQFSLEADKDDIELKDAYLRLSVDSNWLLTLGHFKSVYSLEETNSSVDITFMERALMNVFVPDRRVGVGILNNHLLSTHWQSVFTIAGFGQEMGPFSKSSAKGGNSLSTRMVLIHTLSCQQYFLIGADAAYTSTDSNNQIAYKPTPESFVAKTPLVDTGTIDAASSSRLVGAESVWTYKRLSLQGEYCANHINRHEQPGLNFQGFYAYASLFLTPDYRPIERNIAKIGHVVPKCQLGALELASRYSYLDLQDKDIHGGYERNVSIGLNWYLNQHIRLMANIIKANATKDNIKTEPVIYTCRAQVAF